MIKIGITGGIGSGKTTICKNIEEMGYKVFYSDNDAILLANTNSSLKQDLITEFGSTTYVNGEYNRRYIGGIVFKDKNKLSKLNDIFGKYVDESFENFCTLNKDESVIFYESALIYQHDKEDNFNHIIFVFANDDVIYDRLRKRNKFTNDEIRQRIESQIISYDKLLKTPWLVDTTHGVNPDEIKNLVNALVKMSK